MRKIRLSNDEYYHVFNRGVDKRSIFFGNDDYSRFLQSMKEFNTIEPIGSIYENSFKNLSENQLGDSVSKLDKEEKLVEFVSYCLNPNHYHFILKQVVDKGIEKFMHRLGVGYSMFFNRKYDRSGSLFQGKFKASHIDSNEYLLHLSVYVNFNDKIHKLGDRVSKSSWSEYMEDVKYVKDSFCKKDIILGQFKDIKEFKNFAESSLKDIKDRKEESRNIFLEE